MAYYDDLCLGFQPFRAEEISSDCGPHIAEVNSKSNLNLNRWKQKHLYRTHQNKSLDRVTVSLYI